MKWFYFISAFFIVACSQAPQTLAIDRHSVDTQNARGSLSPSAPVNLTYRIDGNAIAGQTVKIDIDIATRLTSGTLLVEVAKQEGGAVIGAVTQRIDLATAAHPITLQMEATLLGAAEHYLVLLLTVDTEMGPMSRSFRIDLLADTSVSAAQ